MRTNINFNGAITEVGLCSIIVCDVLHELKINRPLAEGIGKKSFAHENPCVMVKLKILLCIVLPT